MYLKSKDKFKSRFTGPYKIIEKTNRFNYIIQLLDNEFSSKFKVHIDRLKYAPKRKNHLLSQKHNTKESTHTYNLRNRN